VTDSPRLVPDVPLASRTTMGIGGEARWFAEIGDAGQLPPLIRHACREGLPWFFLGEGSNVLFPDEGFPGLVIQNRILGRERQGVEVEAGGGENLGELITWLNRQGLGGLERMFGIPGSVAGAVIGNAGASGQEIGDRVLEITFHTGRSVESIRGAAAGFRYRHSSFKNHQHWFIMKITLLLHQTGEDLIGISKSILAKRLLKYPQGLKCPGSFFKNVQVENLPQEIMGRIPGDFAQFGKIPAGKLIQSVGACGASRGDAEVASYHGNLIINRGKATSGDVLALAADCAERVWGRYGIRLEPEIRIVGDNIPSILATSESRL
jgi:UDP-N-acetylmuramate dehydrogenase